MVIRRVAEKSGALPMQTKAVPYRASLTVSHTFLIQVLHASHPGNSVAQQVSSSADTRTAELALAHPLGLLNQFK